MLWLRCQGLLVYPAGRVLVLHALAGQQQQLLQHHTQTISAVAASCDGLLLASASSGPEAGGCADVVVWAVSSSNTGSSGSSSSNASSNSSNMAGGSMFGVRFVLSQHARGCHLLSFSPDSCWLVSVSGGGGAAAASSIVLWDLQSGEAAAIGKTSKVSSDGCGGRRGACRTHQLPVPANTSTGQQLLLSATSLEYYLGSYSEMKLAVSCGGAGS